MKEHAWAAFQPFNLEGPHPGYAWAVYERQHRVAWEWFARLFGGDTE